MKPRGRARGIGLAALVGWALVAICALAPIGASAAGESETGGVGAFALKGTHGYRIFVLAASQPEFRHGEALLLVARANESASYLVPAQVTDTTIDADLGALGQISVMFEPQGPPRALRPGCEDTAKVPFQPGRWVGEITFVGEEGFTSVQTTSARASIRPYLEIFCPGRIVDEAEEWGPGLPGARLAAHERSGPQTVNLQAVVDRPGAGLRLSAAAHERRGRLRVSRGIDVFQPSSGFRFDPLLRFATLKPGGPFSGVGTFRGGAEPAHRWTGSLTVDLPGRRNLRLTGARFEAGMAHAHVTRKVRHLNRPARPSLFLWPTTKHSPIGSATSWLRGPS